MTAEFTTNLFDPPEYSDHEPDNNPHRCNRARVVYAAHCAQWEHSNGESITDEGFNTCDLACLLADLMHLCDSEGVDFDRAVELARLHHAEES